MPFERGKPKTGGRLPGVSNKLTGAFRDAVRHVYTGLGGHANFLMWAKGNETEFYRIASRLIPGEMQEGSRNESIRVVVYGPQPVDEPRALTDQSTDEAEKYETGRHDDASSL